MSEPAELSGHIRAYVARLHHAIAALDEERVEAVGEILFRAYQHGRQVFIVGNGGSAATASHMACDLAKNTVAAHRRRFRVISLTDNVPLLTALGNDVGYDAVFTDQLVSLIQPGDVLIAISGSGQSENVLSAMRYSRLRSATVVALLGMSGGEAMRLADETILVASDHYGVIEDMHLILNHMLVDYFQSKLETLEHPPHY
ncbi:MAG TPA: SIS domain-containing protein [Solirubrobacteraceae bacterium]|jgi:D-sedoheptulose 7-phosphate isomerase|nr:SIS domain-containing protein [Solirubrobacteraceae bacterium]